MSARRQSAAFTLVEMVMSMAILSIVMLACTSAMVLGARAAQGGFGPDSRAAHLIEARIALDQIVADLEVATEIKIQTPYEVVMVVPDRDGDAATETIRYEWSGVAGSELNRVYNGVTTVLASDVSRFNLDYGLRAATKGDTGGAGSSLLGGARIDADLAASQHPLTSQRWVAQYVMPTLPRGTASWSITGVGFALSRNGGNVGTVSVNVHAADAFGKPTGPSLGGGSIDITKVSTKRESVSVSLSATGLDPSKAVVLVFSTADAGPGSVYSFTPNSDTNLRLSTTADGGKSWSTPSTVSAMEVSLYGSYSGS